ncbi:MAG: aminoglycoside phosphotransferase family protein [Lautropia sp.]
MSRPTEAGRSGDVTGGLPVPAVADSSPAMAGLTEVVASLRGLGLLAPDESAGFTPLTGGVSSDIVLVRVADRQFCIKRALSKLKVAALWEAPVARNGAEAAWLSTVADWLPGSVPALLGEDPSLGLFAMEYLAPGQFPVWKTELRDGVIDADFAALVGTRLVEIHSRSADRPDLALRFANDQTFEQIRIEPYLRATALKNPDLTPTLDDIAAVTLATRRVLVHGDVSPKNILHGPDGPVFLDAECAWYGDPAFDLAFCLKHLLLKGAWKPQWRAGYLECFERLARAYLAGVGWEPAAAFERRCARLLPALWLARIDGKSPVEYLVDEAQRAPVRQLARRLLQSPVGRLGEIAGNWRELT